MGSAFRLLIWMGLLGAGFRAGVRTGVRRALLARRVVVIIGGVVITMPVSVLLLSLHG